MKLTAILLCTAMLQVSAAVFSQSATFSFNLKNSSVKEVLAVIEKNSNYKFLYRNELIDVNRKVDIQASGDHIESVMGKLFGTSEIIYKVFEDNLVVITNNRSLSQQQKISGIIIDAVNGEPIIGANVIVEGTTIGVVTDFNGKYAIDLPTANGVLVVSFIGYNTEKIQTSGQSVLNVKLVPDITKLDEVVVIGYQTVKKRDIIGSVASVSSKDLSKSSVATFEQALQGRTAGVIATQQSGQPGSGVMVQIRGAGGFGDQSPLYIVDGVVGANGSSVNPSDIESVDVLKDAGTAAIYGARGANGVVIITTKRGKSGPVKVSFESTYGLQNLPKKMDVLNTRQYINYINQSKLAAGGTIPPQFNTPEKIDSLAMNSTDWQSQIFKKNASVQNMNLSISGGNDHAAYSFSSNYYNQDGILLETYYKRYSIRLNSDFKAGKYFKFGESLSLVKIKQRTNDNGGDWTNVINSALKIAPYLPPYDTDPKSMVHVVGNTGGWPTGTQSWEGNDVGNPLVSHLYEVNPDYNEVQGSLYAQVQLAKQLTYKINFGIGYNNYYNSSYLPKYYSGPYQSNSHPSMDKNGTINQNLLIENTLNYNTTFFEKNNISAIAGISRQSKKYEYYDFGTYELPNQDVRNISTGAGSATRYINGNTSEYRLSSFFGRVNYDYDGKYLLSATFRRDGTSRFGPDKKFGNFPAFSAGWRVSKESFMSGLKEISDLKIYGSWGKLGSDNIADFQYLPVVYTGGNNYNLGGNGTGNESLFFGSSLGGFPNNALQWQANVTTNVGFNLSLFDNSILVNAEYYVRKTDHLLQNVSLPLTSGYSSMYMNAGAVENKGIDLQLTYQRNFGDFHFDVSGNFSFVKNKVTSLGSSPTAVIFDGSILPNQIKTTITQVGQPIGSFYGYNYSGIYQDTASVVATPHIIGTRPGDCQYQDLNGGGGSLDSIGSPDGKITDKDRTIIGNPWPKLVYGFTINAAYKRFDFSIFLQGVYGNDILNVQNSFFGDGYQGRYNAYTKVLDSWTPQNLSASQHRIGNESVNFVVSSRMIEDGSYLRVKNLQIGYTIPNSLLGKYHIDKLRLFVSATNLLTFTKYSGYDPEIGARNNSNTYKGIDVGNYPQSRTFTGGLQLDF